MTGILKPLTQQREDLIDYIVTNSYNKNIHNYQLQLYKSLQCAVNEKICYYQPKSGLTPERKKKWGSNCYRCGKNGHWRSDCGLVYKWECETVKPTPAKKLKEECKLYKLGWEGEKIIYMFLQPRFKSDVLWLNQRIEWYIPFDIFHQQSGEFIEVKTTNKNHNKFHISPREYELSQLVGKKYIIYFVNIRTKIIVRIRGFPELENFKDCNEPITVFPSKNYRKSVKINSETWTYHFRQNKIAS